MSKKALVSQERHTQEELQLKICSRVATKWECGNLEYAFSYFFTEVCMLRAPAKFSCICTNIAAIMSLRKEVERRACKETDI